MNSIGSTLKRQRSRPARRSRDEATNAALVDTVSKFIEEERESFDLLVDELKADSKSNLIECYFTLSRPVKSMEAYFISSLELELGLNA